MKKIKYKGVEIRDVKELIEHFNYVESRYNEKIQYLKGKVSAYEFVINGNQNIED